MFSIRTGPLIEMLFNRWKRSEFAAMLANQYISMSHLSDADMSRSRASSSPHGYLAGATEALGPQCQLTVLTPIASWGRPTGGGSVMLRRKRDGL
jgi:hypothetical protein